MENKSGVELISDKRQKQLLTHGFSIANNAQYTLHELTQFADYWLTYSHDISGRLDIIHDIRQGKTSGWEDKWFSYDKASPIERLVNAGASIAAEIDRLIAARNQ